MRQGLTLEALEDFDFRWGASNRRVRVRRGDLFWVTSTEIMQERTGQVHLARQRQTQHYGYGFAPADVERLFRVY